MKKIHLSIIAVTCLASCLLLSSTNKLTSASAVSQTNLRPLEFFIEKTKVTLLAPKGARVKKNSWGGVEIKLGKSFQIELSTTTEKNILAEVKKEITSNDVNIFKRFLIEDTNSLLYESSPGMNILEFHIYHYKNLGNIAITCENVKGNSFSESQARLMLNSCQSIKK